MPYSPSRRPPVLLIAEFNSPDLLLLAAARLRSAGFIGLDAYSPFPIEGIETLIGASSRSVRVACLSGGVLGAAGAFAMQYYSAVIDYPIQVGGRPTFSWPAFLPITFEMAILGAAIAGFVTFLISCGLPHLHHPVFSHPEFSRASLNRFFISVPSESSGPSLARARELIVDLNPLQISEVGS